MALRPAPKRKVDYQKLDDLQKEIFGSELESGETPSTPKPEENAPAQTRLQTKVQLPQLAENTSDGKNNKQTAKKAKKDESSISTDSRTRKESSVNPEASESFDANLTDMETIAARIASTKAGQGRNTTRPFSLPRTLIIDTTRLKAKFRTIDEQFTQNVIIDFLLREALAAVTPENYRDLRASAYEFVKRAEETTRRSLTVTEEVVYQMSELKAGINLETGRKYSNDEIFSTLLALGVSWLYRNGVLS